MPRKGLGNGLDTMLGVNTTQTRKKAGSKSQNIETKEVIKEVIKEVPTEMTLKIKDIEINKEQPRKQFNEDALQELADSITQHGVIEPLIVTKRDNYYLLVSGERRWRASMKAGLKEVPVVVKDYTDQEILEIGLIENIQREDLNPIEEAQAYQKLIEEFHMKQDDIAERVSKSRSAITNILRLLKLAKPVQEMVIDEKISNGHARALLPIEDTELQYETACKVFDERLSVRETEKLVKKILNDLANPKVEDTAATTVEDLSFLYRDIEEKFKYKLGAKTTIKAKNNDKGKIEIEYFSKDELEHIMEMIYSIQS
ncbi:MAG: ParB/RepB/Spo0J family partition protein [Lachnospiraceae bacterium]|nr:ParB/RepB/Spo0J family partition protein [Lachnospiraceae bacterium]MDY2607946.1 ParB/RepB/Spo0J family partition protein [Lachnospiraceae bacterium]HCJ08154.1 chromosome partitioning protein ParB [Lachnospiraceae bacterium]